MKTTITILTAALSIATTHAKEPFPYKLTKAFEIEGLETPESVIHDQKNNLLYISNIVGSPTDKDNNGYISKISTDGKIIQQKWITGLHAPKGLAIHNNKLYIADIDNIIEVDITTGKKITHPAPAATFLNDLAAAPDGTIYASNTFGFAGIYRLAKGKVELISKGEKLNNPNGLLVQNGNLLIATWGLNPDPKNYTTKTPGKLLQLNLTDNSLTTIQNNLGNLDGLVATIHGHLITDWISGDLIYRDASTGKTYTALEFPKGAADLTFIPKTKTVLIPQMLENKLTAFTLSK